MKRMRVIQKWCALIILMGGVWPAFAQATDRTVKLRVEGFRSDQGRARVEIFDSEHSYGGRQPARQLLLNITNGVAETDLNLSEISDSPFVVRVYHDENDNGILDRTPLGVPDEPIGFSNNARARFGPPTFREAAIRAESEATPITIRLERPLGTDWQIGAGWAVVVRESPYVGGEAQVWTFPNVVYLGRRFSITGPRASYLLAGGDWGKLSAIGQVRFNALDPDDSPELEGLTSRSVTWEMGVRVGLRSWRNVDVNFSALTDVLDRHGGQEFPVEVSRSFKWTSWRWTPALAGTIFSDKLADYYYGVSSKEERWPQRPAYSPGTGWTLTPSIRVLCERWYPWVFSASIALEYLGPQMADSPIVERRTAASGFLSVSRQFGPGARRE